jgi:hypothetical protein
MAEYTEEQLKELLAKQEQELTAKFEAETAGLKANKDALLAEKKKLEEETQAKLLEKEQAAIEAAKEAGDVKKALELEQAKYERERKELSEQLSARNEMILSSKKQASVQSIVSNFAKNDKLSQLTASQLVDYGFSEDGNVVASYKDLDGKHIADNHDDWLKWAKSDPDMQNHLSGSRASGVDPASVTPSKTNKTQDYKGDVSAYLGDAFKQNL